MAGVVELPALFFAVEDVDDVVVVLVLVVLDEELVELDDAVPTTIDTVEPLARLVPPGGACVTTVPTFDCSVTGRELRRGLNPTALIACSAWMVDLPVTNGTVALAGACAITIVTVEPTVASDSAPGSWLITVPAGLEAVIST